MNERPARDAFVHRYAPRSVTLTWGAMVVSSGILLVRFGHAIAVTGSQTNWRPVAVALVGFSGIIALLIPLLAVGLVLRGWIGAPILVTLVGLWGCTELVTYMDALALVTALASVVALVAVWTPSARTWGRTIRDGRSGPANP